VARLFRRVARRESKLKKTVRAMAARCVRRQLGPAFGAMLRVRHFNSALLKVLNENARIVTIFFAPGSKIIWPHRLMTPPRRGDGSPRRLPLRWKQFVILRLEAIAQTVA